MISLSLFGYDFIVLNSARLATDILDKRSGIYSDRLSIPMIDDPSLYVIQTRIYTIILTQ